MKKPNIVFILTDDQSYWALHRETPSIISPCLDKLSEEGAYFSNFFCACPVCSPARASILTGLMPSAHGVQDWLISGNVNVSDMPKFVQERAPIKQNESVSIDFLEGIETYTDVLADNGYNIALSGKWHLGDTLKPRKGYIYWNSILRGGCSYFSYDILSEGKITPHTGYLTDLITDNAIDFVEKYDKGEPFYLGVHYTAPHTPWDKLEHKSELWELYNDADYSDIPNEKIHKDQVLHKYIGDTDEKRREWLTGYFASITGIDKSVQRILDCLKSKGILEDTIIIFTGDNGNNLGQHGVWGKGNGTYPQNMYEESIKVPCIMYNKKQIANTEVNSLCSHVDIFPTILELAGIERAQKESMWGESLLKVIQNQSKRNHIAVFDEYGAVRMIRNERFKYIKNYNNKEEFFFDLENDNKERLNKIDEVEFAEIISKMRDEMEKDFEKYTLNGKDGRLFQNVGVGQKALVNDVNQSNAFATNLKMYYEGK